MKLAIFDIDGTLVHPYPTEDASFVEALRASLGVPDADSNWTSYENVTDTGILDSVARRHLGRAPTEAESERFHEAYWEAFRRTMAPGNGAAIPGAASFVSQLRARPDWRVAVATGNSYDLAIRKLERGGLPCLDLPMATASDGLSRATLLRLATSRARRRFDVRSFEHVVSIGDAPWDLTTARQLGIPFVAVGGRCSPPDGRGIVDFTDVEAVMTCITSATCW